MNVSYWEKNSLLKAEVGIVGGGIVGLSVAASLKEQNPECDVVVFERGLLPTGASTRNAGFACFGSYTELLSDMEVMGEDRARDLLFHRWLGLKITRQRLEKFDVGFEKNGGFELLDSTVELVDDELVHANVLVEDFLPNYFTHATQRKEELGIRGEGQLIQMAQEGSIDTGKLMLALENYVRSLGVRFINGAEVRSVDETGKKVRLTLSGADERLIDFDVEQCVIATNAFTNLISTPETIEPGRGQVFITKPIDQLQFKGNLHMEEGFYYLRNVQNRLLFGGGRNLDFDHENTTNFALNGDIQHILEGKLHRIFGADFQFEIDMRWSGIMCFGKTKEPLMYQHSSNVFVACKMGGMGIALAGHIGEEMAQLIKR